MAQLSSAVSSGGRNLGQSELRPDRSEPPEVRPTKLAILLPFTSRCFKSVEHSIVALEDAIRRLVSNRDLGQAFLCVGVDRQDPIFPFLKTLACLKNDKVVLHPLDRPVLDKLAMAGLQEAQAASTQRDVNHRHREYIKSQPPPPPLCRIWEQMAGAATDSYGATAFVLLGDDTDISPANWTELIIGESQLNLIEVDDEYISA